MHAGGLAGQAIARLSFWISRPAWAGMCFGTRYIAACVFGMAEGGTSHWQIGDHRDADAGLLSCSHPIGFTETAFRRTAASLNAR